MDRWGLFLAAGAITLFTVAIGGLNALYRWQVKPLLIANTSTQDRHHALYLEDADFLAKTGLLNSVAVEGHADAGLTLNDHLHWDPPGPVARGLSSPVISPAIREALLRLGPDWMIHHARAKNMKADLSFFADLGKFDYWDIENHSPIADLIEKKEFVPPPSLPIPEVWDLLDATRLRLMMGAVNRDLLPALKDARFLSKLLLTTENLQLTLAGLTVLDEERKAYRYYVDNLGLPAGAWTPVDRNTTRRANRAILATRGYLRLWTRPQFLQEMFNDDFRAPGLCSAANEAYPLEFSLRPVLEPHVPLELDLRPQYKVLDTIFAHIENECRMKYLKALVHGGSFNTSMPGPLVINRVPYSRKIFGLRLSAANFDGFDAYDKADPGN
jgi:hypothetical protein